ncbi:MAG: hypothetical protein ACHQT8_02510 [Chlamydiales bacterium]
MNKTLLCASLFFFGMLHAEDAAQTQQFDVNLQNPVFTQGVITTDEGGIITAPGIRIQAQKISYTNRTENGIAVQKIEAEGDLMMEYGERVFVGKKLEYNFLTKTGTLWDGKTFVDAWFLGGEKFYLSEDGSYTIYNAYITTCETEEGSWDLHAGAVKITKQHLLSAKGIRFRFAKIPVFWLPNFKANLTMFKDPPIRYKIKWDKGLGPRVTMRYRIFSWEKFNAYFRLDYRLKRGLGAAIETDYHTLDKRTVFRTRSYGAHDKSWPDEKTNKRYRFQGLYQSKTHDGKTFVHGVYDKLSDEKMPGDFRSDDFEVNTQKRTRLLISHHRDQLLASLSLQPRINNFQSINQELPYVTANIRSFQLGRTGVIAENYFNGGYLNYIYAHDLARFLSSTRAGRLETKNQIYRPFNLANVTLTPSLGFVGIFYTNNPRHDSIGQTLLTYGGTASTHLSRSYGHFQHMIEPYAVYQGISNPTARLDRHFIFNMEDGFARMNSLRLGVRNNLFSTKASAFLPPITSDLYTYGFFANKTYARLFPKAYLDIGWNRPSYALFGGVAWNQEEKVWDYTNVRGAYTYNENLAFALEFRHRSRFDWRKADHQNFILDVARPIDELLRSPLSDQRNTLLFRLYGRLMPGLTCLIQSNHGWARRKDPRYSEFKVELFKMVTCSWQLKVAYQYTINDPFQVTAALQLIKPKP